MFVQTSLANLVGHLILGFSGTGDHVGIAVHGFSFKMSSHSSSLCCCPRHSTLHFRKPLQVLKKVPGGSEAFLMQERSCLAQAACHTAPCVLWFSCCEPRVRTFLCPVAIGCSGKSEQTQAVCFMFLQLTRVSCSDSLRSIGR